MTYAVVLDTNTLGVLINPRAKHAAACIAWFEAMIHNGHHFYVPEIADYELRRELIRIGSKSLDYLDRLPEMREIDYMPLTTEAMRLGAQLWARARQEGRPTAGAEALDGDVLISAQALILQRTEERQVVVATDNVRHISRFTAAKCWEDIDPATAAP